MTVAFMPPPVTSALIRVLVADDQVDVLEAVRMLLKAEGCDIETANSPSAVLRAVEAKEFDVVVLDLNYKRDTTSGEEGLDRLSIRLPTVAVSEFGRAAV